MNTRMNLVQKHLSNGNAGAHDTDELVREHQGPTRFTTDLLKRKDRIDPSNKALDGFVQPVGQTGHIIIWIDLLAE